MLICNGVPSNSADKIQQIRKRHAELDLKMAASSTSMWEIRYSNDEGGTDLKLKLNKSGVEIFVEVLNVDSFCFPQRLQHIFDDLCLANYTEG